MLANVRTCLAPASLLSVLAALAIGMPEPAMAATVTTNLCAKSGTVQMPGGVTVPVWGFATKSGRNCRSATAELPGPMIEALVGDTVVINLDNRLRENVSILFPAMEELLPDTAGAPPAGTVSYTFTVTRPGTFIYESGVNPSIQVPMGLHGVLVVRPATPGQAYGPDSAFDVEASVVLSEIDADLNDSANPSSFDLRNYKPDFWLINGKAYPDTAPISASAGDRLLLRYVNAGSSHHTIALLGLHQSLIARDAYPLPFTYDVVGETLASGQTADAITSVSAGTFALRSRQLRLTNGAPSNGAHSPGGMLTFIEVPAAP